jgi:tripartite-type tricarboxylate transporter receptor subunit TctC
MHKHTSRPKLRRALLQAACALLLLPAAGTIFAQDYPAKAVRIVVPGPPGSLNDIVARLLARQLAQQLGQRVNIDNQTGDNGTAAADSVARAAPDGYTLLLGTDATHASNVAMRRLPPYDPVTDFTPIAVIAEDHYVLVANPSLPVKNVAELVEYMKKNPVAYSSAGVGTSAHLAGAMLGVTTGTEPRHLPQTNVAEAVNAVFSSQAQVMFLNAVVAKRHIVAGKMVALGIADAQPSAEMPGVAPIGATLPGYRINGWFALFAPPKLPEPILERLNAEVGKALALPDLSGRYSGLSLTPIGGSALQLDTIVRQDVALRAKMMKAARIDPE